MRYNCTLRGQCEEDNEGPFTTPAECESRCWAATRRDEVELIFQYNLADAARLAPSDRSRIIFNLTRVSVPVQDSRAVLLALDQMKIDILFRYPALIDYIRQVWPPGAIRTALRNTGTVEGLNLLEQLFQLNEEDIRTLAKIAIQKQEVDTLEELFERGYDEILLSLEQYLLTNGTQDVVAVYLDYVVNELLALLPVAARQGREQFLNAFLDAGLTTRAEIRRLRLGSDDEDEEIYDDNDGENEETEREDAEIYDDEGL